MEYSKDRIGPQLDIGPRVKFTVHLFFATVPASSSIPKNAHAIYRDF